MLLLNNTVGPFNTHSLYNMVQSLTSYNVALKLVQYTNVHLEVMELDGLYRRALCSWLFVYKMDCLNSHESVLFLSTASSESSLPAMPFPIYALVYFPLFP